MLKIDSSNSRVYDKGMQNSVNEDDLKASKLMQTKQNNKEG